MAKLEDLRNKIDKVDDSIASLYVSRMELCKQVGEFKLANNLPTENTLREKELLNRVTEKMPDDIKLFGKQTFNCMMDTSKAYQATIVDTKSQIKSDIFNALKNQKDFPISTSVACQGIEGSYSSIATEKLFELSSITYCKDWNSVFVAVDKGLCDYGVLPIENSSVGSVNKVYDLMREHNFYIARSIKLKIQHYLLANKGAKIENIKEIVSHEQAILQCSKFLEQLGDVKITVCDNTAKASKIVCESDRDDIACISSRECVGVYGLEILKPMIQDNDSNYTRFIAISKKLEIFEGANKISIITNLPHEVGSLNKVLNRFSTHGLNLTKLESRPLANSVFEFAFYFDFIGDVKKKEVQNLLSELNLICDNFIFLGSYSEI